MSALAARWMRSRLPAGAVPAFAVLALGLAVLVLRPPLPIDETRYLEVFRESLRASPLLLRLLGEPYAEKPPLLFWLARGMTWLAIPPDLALRCLPPLALGATVLVVDRLGRRVGLTLAGWLQAALWVGSLNAQFLHFDPLLTLSIWAALEAWVRRSDLGFMAWSAAALLAKGPVAYLFLVPFLWSLAPLRAQRPGDARRTSLALALALVPLAAWALAAAAQGGDAFARALLWDRWAGRIGGDTPHARSLLFYVPIVLVGSLPATLFLFRGRISLDEGGARRWSTRLGRALLLILLGFTLIRGKQAHYLEPAVPGLALVLAWRIESRPHELVRLRRGIRALFGLLACLVALVAVLVPGAAGSVSTRGNELLSAGGFVVPLAIAGSVALAGLALTWMERLSPRSLLCVSLVGAGACLLPVHWLAGQLLFPHELAEALRRNPSEVAYLGTSHHGIYALLAATPAVEKLDDAAELVSWSAIHPDSLVLVDPKALGEDLPAGFVVVARDVVHRAPVLVLRRGS